jgi:tetratricopeptide (TPR) repeat protein
LATRGSLYRFSTSLQVGYENGDLVHGEWIPFVFSELHPAANVHPAGQRDCHLMKDFESARQCFFEGLQLLEANNLQAAESQFARSLELIPERVSTLNNLSAVKIRLSKFSEAESLARKAVGLDEKSAEAWSNLATALAASARTEEALRACERALACNPSYAMAWLARAATLRGLRRYEEGLEACDHGLTLEPGNYQLSYHKSLILKDLNRLEEAQGTYRRAFDLRVGASPVFVGERSTTQKAEVLILNANPEIDDDSFLSFEDLSRFCSNFPGQLADRFREDIHFNYVFVGDAIAPSARKQIPQPDFIINNHTNGEALLSGGNLRDLNELINSFGVPTINHPTKAVPTARDVSAKLLQDIPGVLVPKTTRFSSVGKTLEELVREIESQFEYPLITRTLTSQEGKGMNKVESRDGLTRTLSAADCPEKFFVTQFIDSRRGNKFFRKIRAAVVKDEIIIVRVDHDDYWKIYARKSDERVAFYLTNAHLLEEEKRMVNAPEAELGPAAIRALRAIRERTPLDVFGIDFDVNAEGVLVFYEANATMNLFSTARKEIPYPKEADERLKAALRSYFAALVPGLSA